MKAWIKRLARFLSFGSFFVVLAASIDPQQPLDGAANSFALVKAFAAAVLFWLVGFVTGDIVLKGVIDTIDTGDVAPSEGGLLQRVHDEKQRQTPESVVIKPGPGKDAQGEEHAQKGQGGT